MLLCPVSCALADQHIMFAKQYPARQLNGIFDSLNGSNGADLQGGTIHQSSIKLNHPGLIEMRTGSGIKRGIIFQDGDSYLNRIQGCATGRQDIVTGQGRYPAAISVGIMLIAGNPPGPPVNDDGGVHKMYLLIL